MDQKAYEAKSSERPFSDFLNLLNRHFGSDSQTGTKLTYDLYMNRRDEVADFYKLSSDDLQLQFRLAIQKGYRESVRLKNEGESEFSHLKRLMDIILNIEVDKINPNIKTLSDLVAVFEMTNRMTGSRDSIGFPELLGAINFFQGKLRDNKSINSEYRKIEKKFTFWDAIKMLEVPSYLKLKKKIWAYKILGRTGGKEVWIFGSVLMGRGITGISDLDFFVPNVNNAYLSHYLSSKAGPDTALVESFSEISSTDLSPFDFTHTNLKYLTSRWFVKISENDFTFYVYDMQTRSLRPLAN
ncbi:MAG: hypothetical protein JNL11_19500 [Bdellovibrionaceae bacterium]|nr:hypothetical protein [Pseudobdellovibrionaceae bacterium]